MSKAVNPPIFTGQFKVSQPPPEHTFSVAVSIHSLSKNKGPIYIRPVPPKTVGRPRKPSQISRLNPGEFLQMPIKSLKLLIFESGRKSNIVSYCGS